MKDSDNKILNVILPVTIFIAVIINLFILRNLFHSFFFEDDFAFLDLGAQLKTNPLLFFTYTFGIYWRPLGFGSIAILYQFFQINPLPYHIAGYLLHLLTAFSVYLLCKKISNKIAATFAAIIYISYPISILSVGYITTAFQDQLATFFFIMTFYYLIDPAGKYKNQAYWLPFLMFLGGSLCKDSYIALYPTILLIDWINYKDSSFRGRLKRLYPFILVLLEIPIRLLLVNANRIVGIAELHLGGMSYFDNFLWGLVQVFFPANPGASALPLTTLFIAMTVFFVIMPLLLLPDRRNHLISLITAMFLVTAMVSVTVPNTNLRGWSHFQFNSAVSSILISITLLGLFGYFRHKMQTILATYIIATTFIVFQYNYYDVIIKIYENKSNKYKTSYVAFEDLSKSLPPNTHIYMISGPPVHLARDAILPGGFGYTQLQIQTTAGNNLCDDDVIAGDLSFIKEMLAGVIEKPTTRILQIVGGGQIADVTQQVHDYIVFGKPFRLYSGRI